MLVRRRFGPSLLVLFVSALALFLGAVQTQVAWASAPCRDDPTIMLSDGTTISMSEDIYDRASDVTKVSYRLHIPRGLTVQAVAFSGDISASIQSLSVVADENTGTYDAFVNVFTAAPNVSITAYMTATSSGGITTASYQTDGHSGQSLHSYLQL